MDSLTGLGERLRQAMEAAGLTVAELAGMAGLSERQLYRYLGGKDGPSALATARLAQALRVTSDYLLGIAESGHRCPVCGGRLRHRERQYWCDECAFEGIAADVEPEEEYQSVGEMWRDRMPVEVVNRPKKGRSGSRSGRRRKKPTKKPVPHDPWTAL